MRRPAIVALAGLAITVTAYTQMGVLGLTLSPVVALVLVSVAVFAAGGAFLTRGRVQYPLSLALPLLAQYAAFFLAPLGLLAAFAVATNEGSGVVKFGFSLENVEAALDPLYIGVFLRTLQVAGVGTALTMLIGFPMAYWLARYAPAKRRSVLLGLVMVPFLTSFLIRTYAFLIVLSPTFFLSEGLQSIGLIAEPLEILNTVTAVQIGMVYNYLPLFVLPVYAALERIDWRLVDAAQDLGASPSKAFRQITVPLATPGLLAGGVLTFIPMMGEYVIPSVLGGGRLDLIGNVIGRAFLDQQDYPFGAALGLLVMLALSGALALNHVLSKKAGGVVV